jgi:phosphoribosylformimino-5-aminoimidazole carboxamide ribotide isomerase
VKLFPAIDIQDGRAVRLRRGDFADATVFADDPVEQAREWERQGAEGLHVVDLDGARRGELVNFDLVRGIVEAVAIPVQYGGGVRNSEALQTVAASGLEWVVLGTAAVTDLDLLDEALAVLGPRLVVGVDCERGIVATHGWQERSEMSALHFVRLLKQRGVRRIVYTDVLRDGMLEGPNLEGLSELTEATDLEIVMSGGISRLEDLRWVKREAPDVVAIIVGRALYEGTFTLAQAKAALA